MNILDFTSDELFKNIQELLNNKMFGLNTRRASAIIQSDSMTALEKASFWIEHVIEFGGSHLRSSTMDMPFYQFLMLDFVAVFVVMALLLFAACVMLWKWIMKKIRLGNVKPKVKTT